MTVMCCVFLVTKIQIREADIVAQWVKSQPVMPACHMGNSSSPDCSTFDPAPCQGAWASLAGWPSAWTPATHRRDQDAVLDSWFWPCPALAVVL